MRRPNSERNSAPSAFTGPRVSKAMGTNTWVAGNDAYLAVFVRHSNIYIYSSGVCFVVLFVPDFDADDVVDNSLRRSIESIVHFDPPPSVTRCHTSRDPPKVRHTSRTPSDF